MIEFLQMHGFTLTQFVNFYTFGMGLNVIGIMMLVVGSFVKGMTLNKEQVKKYEEFVNSRRQWIDNNTSKKRQLLKIIEFFFPTYKFITAIIRLLYMFGLSSEVGLIIGLQVVDKISIIPLITYRKPE